jgi:CMP-N,N'-diacetyllegionaminic acid synthase
MKKETFVAIIPARAGSRRLKNKNIMPFGDSNLLVHKIRQLKQVPSIDRIVVSSDSDEYLAMAEAEGVIGHKRAGEFAIEGEGQTKSFGEFVKYAAENVEGDHIVWCQPTSPLVTPEVYEDAIQKYKENVPSLHDSLASVEAFQKHMWDDKGPINYERGAKHVLSQQLPVWYFVTGVFIAPRQKMIEWVHNIGPNPYKYRLKKINCNDIDDELDLDVARAWHDRVCSCLTEGWKNK